MQVRGQLTWADLGLIAFSVTMTVGAQLSLRHGMSQAEGGAAAVLVVAVASPWVWGGLGMYGLSAASWLTLLSRVDLVVAYPLGSLNFVIVTLLSRWVLHEEVSPVRWLGTLIILAGIWIIARAERRRSPA